MTSPDSEFQGAAPALKRCDRCGASLPDEQTAGLCPKCLMAEALSPVEGEGTVAAVQTAPPSPEEIAKHFPQLEIIECLGRGGMGIVYKARQPSLDRVVALKVLPRELGGDPAFAERFQREARALAKLNHPNIVALYEFGEAGGFCYFLMEFVDGANLRQVQSGGKLDPEEALAIVPKICEALQFAHDEGIVHRDIKPENILIDSKGRVKIADFGLARLRDSVPPGQSLTRTQQVMGTPHYMAPEQMQGTHSVDHRADIYSLGVVFYEMLTGTLPRGRFDPPSKRVRVDVRLDEIVLHSLEQEPERRYQQASQVKTDVEGLAAGAAPARTAAIAAEAKLAADGKDSRRRSRRIPLIAASLAIALLVAAFLGFPAYRDYALSRAIDKEDPEAVVRWLRLGADPDTANRHGSHVLPRAVARRDRRMVEDLLAAGADADRGSSLAWAAVFGDTEIALRLLEAGAEVDRPLLYGVTPLMIACALGHLECAELLIGQGAQVNARDTGFTGDAYYILGDGVDYRWPGKKLTPLMLAACEGNSEIVALLLRHGARPGMEDAEGRDARAFSKANGHEKLGALLAESASTDPDSEQLSSSGSGPTELIAAAARGQTGAIRALLKSGLDVNDKGPGGATALIEAARGGHASTVLSLILLGANLNETDAEGRTALMAAAERNQAAVAKALYDFENTINVIRRELRDHDESALAAGSTSDADSDSPPAGREPRTKPSGSELLKQRINGVDLRILDEVGLRLPEIDIQTNAQDRKGETALMKAAARGHIEFAKAMRAWEEDNVQDLAGRSAAMHAALNGQAEFIKALLTDYNHGHGTSAGTFRGHTMFDAEVLAQKDHEGKTALVLAEEGGHPDVVALLRDELQRASEHYNRAIEMGGPWTCQSYNYRGWIHAALGEEDLAEADLKEARRRGRLELQHNGWLEPRREGGE